MSKPSYTVARKVYTPVLDAPLTFSGHTPTKLTFEAIAKGLTRQQAMRMCMLEQRTDPNVVFYKE